MTVADVKANIVVYDGAALGTDDPGETYEAALVLMECDSGV